MNVILSVTGYEQIDAVLRGLHLLYSHKVLQAAHAEAAKPLVEKQHRLAPVGKTGRLADSIGTVKPSIRRVSVVGEVIVGPRRGRFGGHHAHFNEFGTRQRNFDGANRGVMPAKPFLRPAFEQTNAQVVSRISLSLGQKTYAFMRRTIKNG
jgi:HK97 gp10 family phage protein